MLQTTVHCHSEFVLHSSMFHNPLPLGSSVIDCAKNPCRISVCHNDEISTLQHGLLVSYASILHCRLRSDLYNTNNWKLVVEVTEVEDWARVLLYTALSSQKSQKKQSHQHHQIRQIMRAVSKLKTELCLAAQDSPTVPSPSQTR